MKSGTRGRCVAYGRRLSIQPPATFSRLIANLRLNELRLFVVPVEEVWKNACAFFPDRVQRLWGKPEGTQDRRRDLGRMHQVVNLALVEGRSRDKQGHMTVVERPATMLGNLLLASRVDHAVIGLNEDVGRSRCGD